MVGASNIFEGQDWGGNNRGGQRYHADEPFAGLVIEDGPNPLKLCENWREYPPTFGIPPGPVNHVYSFIAEWLRHPELSDKPYVNQYRTLRRKAKTS